MDYTQGSFEEKNARAKKMMLYFGIVSLIMSFGGLTSAYIVSSTRPDWLTGFSIPVSFLFSTIVLIISSVTFLLAKMAIKKDNHSATAGFLWATLALGLVFIVLQFKGFGEFIGAGYYFTGPSSNVTVSFIYIIAFVHILHVVAGLISLLTVLYNHYRKKYSSNDYLGLSLAATFWHFLDFLWIYLILFFYFFR